MQKSTFCLKIPTEMFETVDEKDEKALLCSLMYNEQPHGVLPIIGNPLTLLPSVIVFTECNISFAVSGALTTHFRPTSSFKKYFHI